MGIGRESIPRDGPRLMIRRTNSGYQVCIRPLGTSIGVAVKRAMILFLFFYWQPGTEKQDVGLICHIEFKTQLQYYSGARPEAAQLAQLYVAWDMLHSKPGELPSKLEG